jgi:hypothetical protein
MMSDRNRIAYGIGHGSYADSETSSGWVMVSSSVPSPRSLSFLPCYVSRITNRSDQRAPHLLESDRTSDEIEGNDPAGSHSPCAYAAIPDIVKMPKVRFRPLIDSGIVALADSGCIDRIQFEETSTRIGQHTEAIEETCIGQLAQT